MLHPDTSCYILLHPVKSCWLPHLILIEVLVDQFVLTLLLERDDDQRHEDVDEEEWEDDEVDDVEDGHLHAEAGRGALVDERRVHRVLEDPVERGTN